MIDDYPNTLAYINIHVWDDSYDLPWGNNRADFYDVGGIPHIVYDGHRHAGGAGSPMISFMWNSATAFWTI